MSIVILTSIKGIFSCPTGADTHARIGPPPLKKRRNGLNIEFDLVQDQGFYLCQVCTFLVHVIGREFPVFTVPLGTGPSRDSDEVDFGSPSEYFFNDVD